MLATRHKEPVCQAWSLSFAGTKRGHSKGAMHRKINETDLNTDAK